MIIFSIATLIILLTISIVFGIIQYRARVKNQKTMLQMLYKVHKALMIMHQIDQTGAFQSDDEVGKVFLLITTTIEQLRNYFINKVGDKVNEKTQS